MNIRNNIETTRVVNSKINLSILKDCRGQGYDNAATMAGIYTGV